MHATTPRRLALSLAVAITAQGSDAQPRPTRVWEGTLTIPTYQEGRPDLNAPFDVFSVPGRPNYPYTIRDQLTNVRAPRAWRALFLENEFLRCSVLPDLGGHLYSCADKVNGEEMFYANGSIKYSNIAYRGSWAAFGIEFNFPVSHNWMTTSPVDWATGTERDGSAWIEVGNIDRPYGMQWTVRLTLRPGHARLDQHTTLYNRSDVRRRYYWWTNAAVRAWDDTRILYPMKFTASHGFSEVDAWPVDSRGTDNSVLRNHVHGPVSRFAHGSREGFMGIWHPRTNAGVAHYAPPEELPAKKIWSWGVDADAMDWRRQLSDDSSAYVEIQAGLFRDQETYGWLQPQEVVTFHEYWMPLRGLGGLTRMNPEGALFVERVPAGADSVVVRVALQLTRSVQGATLALNGHVVPVAGSPAVVERRELRLRRDAPPVHVTLRAPTGVLLAHEEGRFDFLPDSMVAVGRQELDRWPPPERRLPSDWVAFAEFRELDGDMVGADSAYRRALRGNTTDVTILRALARMSAARGDHLGAQMFASYVYARFPSDHEMAYHRGLGAMGRGDSLLAQSDFAQARQSATLRAASLIGMLRSDPRLRSDRRTRLMEFVAASAEATVARVRELRAVAAWLVAADRGAPDDSARARAIVDSVLTGHPTSGIARYVRTRLSGPDTPFERHVAGDAERLLDVAEALLDLGAEREAGAVLGTAWPDDAGVVREEGMPHPNRHPIVEYTRAFALARAERTSEGPLHPTVGAALDRAMSLPLLYIFPHRVRTREVLEWVLRVRPGDQGARYLLGMMDLQRSDAMRGSLLTAIARWDSVRTTRRDIPGLHRSLGHALLLQGDVGRALTIFREGVDAEPLNAAVWTGLDSLLSRTGADAATRAAALDRYPDRAGMPTALVYRYAAALADAGRFDDAERLFADRWFSRVEGGTNPRGVWLEVRSKRALAAARRGDCTGARAIVRSLPRPVRTMEFTRDGLPPFLTRASIAARLAEVRTQCGGA